MKLHQEESEGRKMLCTLNGDSTVGRQLQNARCGGGNTIDADWGELFVLLKQNDVSALARRCLRPFRISRFALPGFYFLFSLTAGVLCSIADEAQAPASELAGTFRTDDGGSVMLYHETNQVDLWVMEIADASSNPMTLYLKGDGRELAPEGLQTASDFHGAPMALNFDGERFYGRGMSGTNQMEILHSGGGADPVVSVNGAKPGSGVDSAEEIEARLLTERYMATWEKIRKSTVQVNAEGLEIIPSKEAAEQERLRSADPRRIAESPRRQFMRRAPLSEAEAEAMRGAVVARESTWKAASDVTARQQQAGKDKEP